MIELISVFSEHKPIPFQLLFSCFPVAFQKWLLSKIITDRQQVITEHIHTLNAYAGRHTGLNAPTFSDSAQVLGHKIMKFGSSQFEGSKVEIANSKKLNFNAKRRIQFGFHKVRNLERTWQDKSPSEKHSENRISFYAIF